MDVRALISIGFEEKEAKIYLAALNLGVSSVQKIAEKAEVKRPTAYLYIQKLLSTGLLQKIPGGKKEYYAASDPDLLKERFVDNFKLFQTHLPELKNLYRGFAGKLKIRVLEGEKGLEEVYATLCKANHISFIADLSSIEKNFYEPFNKISQAIAENEIQTREIIPNNEEAKNSSRRFSAIAGKFYSSRIAVSGPIYNDCAIYGDTVAFFRINEFNLFVILIEEPTIAATLETLFHLAWQSATPFIGK